MIKDIVVNLSVSARQGHAAEDYAISAAGALEAHITGIAFIYDAYVPLVYPLMSYGETPPEVIDALKHEKVAGHGHSRMREFFLGDVTDAVLRSVKLPVLMSH